MNDSLKGFDGDFRVPEDLDISELGVKAPDCLGQRLHSLTVKLDSFTVTAVSLLLTRMLGQVAWSDDAIIENYEDDVTFVFWCTELELDHILQALDSEGIPYELGKPIFEGGR